MPVLGMLSVFDWSEMGDKEKTWSGGVPSAVPPRRNACLYDLGLRPRVVRGEEG